jgi:hypothetical protein
MTARQSVKPSKRMAAGSVSAAISATTGRGEEATHPNRNATVKSRTVAFFKYPVFW